MKNIKTFTYYVFDCRGYRMVLVGSDSDGQDTGRFLLNIIRNLRQGVIYAYMP